MKSNNLKINNAEALRDYVLEALSQFEKGKIDAEQLAAINKSSETVQSGLKIQLAYCNMRNEVPHIEFLQRCNKIEPNKKLEHKEKL